MVNVLHPRNGASQRVTGVLHARLHFNSKKGLLCRRLNPEDIAAALRDPSLSSPPGSQRTAHPETFPVDSSILSPQVSAGVLGAGHPPLGLWFPCGLNPTQARSRGRLAQGHRRWRKASSGKPRPESQGLPLFLFPSSPRPRPASSWLCALGP